MAKIRTKAVSAALIGVCVIASTFKVLSLRSPSNGGPPQLRRSLTWAQSSNTMLPINAVVREHIKPLSREPDPSQETVLFWHIPKSGGTTLKNVYKCMKKIMTVRIGADPKFGHDKGDELVVFEPGHMGVSFVNVDTLTKPGILRAEELGLVPSGLADIIVSNNLNFAVEHLYDEYHKGRVIALFRHPVERLVSKFYYSQIASWERSYRPEWADMDLQYWADNINTDNECIVKTLAGLRKDDAVTEADFRVAVRTVKQRFIVGLMSEMEESIHRFNVFMGIDESEKNAQECMNEFFGHGVKKSNSNSHQKVDERDPAWQQLAKDNYYDVRLYEEIVKVFDEQREIIQLYAMSMAASNGLI